MSSFGLTGRLNLRNIFLQCTLAVHQLIHNILVKFRVK